MGELLTCVSSLDVFAGMIRARIPLLRKRDTTVVVEVASMSNCLSSGNIMVLLCIPGYGFTSFVVGL